MEFDYIQMIGSVGFPIVAYLLMFFELSKNMKDLIKEMNSLNNKIEELCKKIG